MLATRLDNGIESGENFVTTARKRGRRGYTAESKPHLQTGVPRRERVKHDSPC